MNDNRVLYVEEAIIGAVKRLLAGRINEILAEEELSVPSVEFSGGYGSVCPHIVLSTCERTEKERIIRLDAYTLTISFIIPEEPCGERYCYTYAAAVEKALTEKPSLDGTASRAVLTGKKYIPPKKPLCGADWEVILTVRVVTEGMSNAG
jgi:hypothetical protein